MLEKEELALAALFLDRVIGLPVLRPDCPQEYFRSLGKHVKTFMANGKETELLNRTFSKSQAKERQVSCRAYLHLRLSFNYSANSRPPHPTLR